MIHEKLSKARVMLMGKDLKKSGANKYAGYTYFELGDFLPEALRIFNELKMFAATDFSDWYGEHPMARLRIIDCEDQSEVIFSSPYGTAALKGCHDIQNKGAEQTYLRRYLWMQALEIVEHDAIDKVTGQTERKNGFNTSDNTVLNPKSVAKTDYENLSESDKTMLNDWLISLYDALNVSDNDGYEVFKEFQNAIATRQNLIELKNGLWSQLSSKQRATLKRIHDSKKVRHDDNPT